MAVILVVIVILAKVETFADEWNTPTGDAVRNGPDETQPNIKKK